MLLSNVIKKDYQYKNYKIILSKTNEQIYLYKNNISVLADNNKYVTKYCAKYLHDDTIKSGLIFGLGLGLIPYYFQDKWITIDIIDNEPDLIKLINDIGYLKSNVNIIEADAFTYITHKKYDIIIVDIFWNIDELTTEVEYQLQQHYTQFLNENGQLHFWINETKTS